MAKLTSKQVTKMPKSEFAIPEKRKYPIPDKSHAANALARVEQFGTPAEKKEVVKAVAKKFPEMAKNSSVPAVKKAVKTVKKGK